MVTVKSRETFFEPDPGSVSLGPRTLEGQYEVLKYFQLHDGVPEAIRSYMSSVVTLWLYGWLYYPFYALVVFLSTTAVEMALQARLPKKAGKNHRTLRPLLEQARKAGLLRDEGFPSLEYRREAARAMAEVLGNHGLSPEPPYVDVLVEYLHKGQR